ncbi:hypothetical protein JIG36_34805 [Actinoplanes sp. LDG1-06]|uniref:Uncharacterized protein n=1 Tax=Paractinoplanes ovalisporus TaxID=2810368 RepID=A0ABS2ALE2_9ACTN|nr:hypothetical protein [Actinoplanes ovalisporus]MBM2620684.1 hypothetical protein [Actinoplanes ovalisporus]
MAETVPARPAYVVLRETGPGAWEEVGEVARRPGLPARRGRAQAVEDVLGHPPGDGERYAVVPRSEWRVALDW